MKKGLTVFIVLVLVACFTTVAFADEILFRKIPWFSNYDTVMETLDKLNVTWNTPSSTTGKYIIDYVKEASSNSDRDYQCVCLVSSEGKNLDLQVAGYNVSGMTLFFAFIPDSDGIIDHSVENTSFYMARYTIKSIEDYELSLKDLVSKLTELYGKPRLLQPEDGCDSTIDDIYTWSGDKDTFVYLAGDSNQFGPSIRLYYGTAEGDNLVKNAEKTQRQMDLDALKEAGSDGL